MRKRMWMGPRAFEMWVPMPKIDPTFSRGFFQAQTALLNGGTTIRQSKAGHNVYGWEWNKGSWADIMPIRDMADGVFDTKAGINPVYFIEPTSMRRNVMNQGWATPVLGYEDAMPLLYGQRPAQQVETRSDWGLPARSAIYAAQATPRPMTFYVPIPPGFAAHFGYVGDASGQVQVAEVSANGTQATVHTPDGLTGEGGVFTNLVVNRDDTSAIGIDISLAGTGTARLRALTCRIQRIGEDPITGKPWSGGMGHSGCVFTDKVGLTPNSVPLDMIAASATLEEVGDWL